MLFKCTLGLINKQKMHKLIKPGRSPWVVKPQLQINPVLQGILQMGFSQRQRLMTV